MAQNIQVFLQVAVLFCVVTTSIGGITDFQKAFSELQNEVKEIRQQSQEEIKSLQNEVKEIRQQSQEEIKSLQNEVEESKEEISSLQNEVEESKEEIKSLHKKIEQLERLEPLVTKGWFRYSTGGFQDNTHRALH